MISLTNTPNNFNLTDMTLNNILKFMCGRTDFYWEYLNGVPFTIKEPLSPEKLNIHFLGGNALGFSPFIDNEHIMFLGWDFDAHTSDDLTREQNDELVRVAQEDATKVFNFLNEMGLCVVLNSSGSKGRHVRLYCEGAVAKQMRVFGHYVLWKLLGDHNKHEVFPKQDNLNSERPYGNQMKGYLCVHPKKKQRANIMVNNNLLDFEESVKFIEKQISRGMGSLQISEKDYLFIEGLMHNNYSGDFDSSKFKDSGVITKLDYCKFIEEVATTKVLPSKNKYARHTCIDPNIQAYSYFNPEAKRRYAEIQGRRSDTAFKNWEHYWKDKKPVLKCKQIISYLKNHPDNENCKLGLKCCQSCPIYKEMQEEQLEPKGWACAINIKKFALKHSFTSCHICNTAFNFNEKLGWFSCSTCNYHGGLKDFAERIIKHRSIKCN
jgi:hypothetical protein